MIRTPSLGNIFGYHGCDATLVHEVMKGGSLRPSLAVMEDGSDAYHWLGDGIYFWENDPSRALEWAWQQKRLGKIKEPAVVGAVIDLGVCMNLLERPYLEQLRHIHDEAKVVHEAVGIPWPSNIPSHAKDKDEVKRYLDHKVVMGARNAAMENGFSYDTLRAVFWEGKPLYPGAGFRTHNHIQICVVNPACVRGYFLPVG